MSTLSGTPNAPDTVQLGGGAQFWVYLSPQNNTKEVVKKWKVIFSQGNWTGSISSDNPQQVLQTPGLSGIFDIQVLEWTGSTLEGQPIPPQPGSRNQIGCNSNCASMVGILADAEPSHLIGAPNATFWTTWDAMCTR